MCGIDRLALQLQVVEELRLVRIQMADHVQEAAAEHDLGGIPGRGDLLRRVG